MMHKANRNSKVPTQTRLCAPASWSNQTEPGLGWSETAGCTCWPCSSWRGASAYHSISCRCARSPSAFWKCHNYLYPITISWSTQTLTCWRYWFRRCRKPAEVHSEPLLFAVNTQVLLRNQRRHQEGDARLFHT